MDEETKKRIEEEEKIRAEAKYRAEEELKKKKVGKMNWFDTKEIKNKESLSEKQISYLEKPSLTVYGPFNIIARNHWDFLIATFFILLLDDLSESVENTLVLYIFLGIIVYLHYFFISNGRRLSWNRNQWKSFDKFKESEKKWMPWGVIFFIIMIFSFLSAFLIGFFEGISGL
jgi:hypothetical protein